jgi:hypothetical protein
MINDSIIEYRGILFYNIIISHINMVRNEIADRVVVELLILLKKMSSAKSGKGRFFLLVTRNSLLLTPYLVT